ncbi:SdrD B-like domain-containing protein [Macrococcoides canis]|uniref:SdrD B-like domain-containing protein n=1 Tax=Macrococcoides canis TaxID=1855823 RepID=UPI0022B8CF7A|nr:SdrD B-like domain-containing protein [Macrococcus canis]WBF52768.1 carboxypeptidase regulatory-like domain-containing protein [Macrococcus canis]
MKNNTLFSIVLKVAIALLLFTTTLNPYLGGKAKAATEGELISISSITGPLYERNGATLASSGANLFNPDFYAMYNLTYGPATGFISDSVLNIMYCIEPNTSESGDNTGIITSQSSYGNYTDAQKEYIRLALNYGFYSETKQFSSYEEEYQFAVTQAVIWSIATGNFEDPAAFDNYLYGSDSAIAADPNFTANSNPNAPASEVRTIQGVLDGITATETGDTSHIASIYTYAENLRNDILSHSKQPSFIGTENEMTFDSATGKYTVTLTDTNNVLGNYDISYPTGVTGSVSGNELTLTSDQPIDMTQISMTLNVSDTNSFNTSVPFVDGSLYVAGEADGQDQAYINKAEPMEYTFDVFATETTIPTTEEPTTEAPTTEAPTTEAPTTEEPTTEAPTTEAPTTEAPTTEEPTTEAPTTEAPTTEEPTTEAPTTEEPTTEAPTTEEPTTEAPTTEEPTTEAPTTEEPTTEAPTTEAPTTEEPTTEAPTTEVPTTEEPTTEEPTTEEPTTEAPTTEVPTTEAPTTEEPTTEAPTTEVPTTEAPTTEEPTTEAPTTEVPTTEAPTTEEPTTEVPTTEAPTTEAPTTEEPTTEEPTTEAPTTEIPTTEAPTTEEPTTEAPTTEEPTTEEPTTEVPTTEAPCVKIGDYVWNDENRNGIQDEGEQPIAGVTVTLEDENGKVIATTTTDENGYYAFECVEPGKYVVNFETPEGMTPTVKNEGDNDGKDSDGTRVPVTVGEEDDLTIDSGFYETPDLGNYVWVDADKDGQQDENEEPVSGVTVTLKDDTGKVIATTTTDETGHYIFEDLEDGTYTVEFTVPEGYEVTPVTSNEENVDGNSNKAETPATIDGKDNMTIDLGLVVSEKPCVKIGDYVWNDENRNGIQDEGEQPIAGVTVTLEDENGKVIATTTTDENGYYAFECVEPGKYVVNFETPEGMTPTVKNEGDNDGKDSDGTRVPVTVGEEDDLTIDSGFYETPDLGNYVWVDADKDGQQDENEEPVSGVTVTLKDDTGKVIATTTTDETGHYIFEDLEDGTYTVEFTVPEGYEVTPVTSNEENVDGNSNKAVTPATIDGEDNMTIDLGLVVSEKPCVKIGDYVWNDENRNGIQDKGEQPIAGVTVTLEDENGKVIATTTTDENGYYVFECVEPGKYVVNFETPEGMTPTVKNEGDNDGKDSDGTRVSVTVGEKDDLTIDSGFYTPEKPCVKIGDYVWNDENRNGIQDKGEQPIAGVTVTLEDENGKVIATTTTDKNGYYAFECVEPGKYVVNFETPEGMTPTVKNEGDNDGKDSDGTRVSVTVGEKDDLTIDSGFYTPEKPCVKIGDYVWNDENRNGIQDKGEQPIAGVTVTLEDENGKVIATTTTDKNGYYAFECVEPGKYVVNFETPEGMTPTVKNEGDNDGKDSDGTRVSVTVGEKDDLTIDSGFYTPKKNEVPGTPVPGKTPKTPEQPETPKANESKENVTKETPKQESNKTVVTPAQEQEATPTSTPQAEPSKNTGGFLPLTGEALNDNIILIGSLLLIGFLFLIFGVKRRRNQ